METMFTRSAGLDVHESNVVACVVEEKSGRAQRETHTFSAMPDGLTTLRIG